ncbi:hypothetical protein CDL15_Pgr000335 [Punica granatum]|uniref:Uncharacterized protein n=1 Tax=Punica granatum TaxID=22663 RepID=A0A218XSX9_PUNGR|nr:hypothetical protein CDL15_Pgr000335 [Punica granatum]
MRGRSPKAVNAGPGAESSKCRTEARCSKCGVEAQKWGRSPMSGRSPKVGPKPDAVNAGSEPDAGSELDVGLEPNAVNVGPEPDARPEPDVVLEPNAINVGPDPNAANAGSIGKCKNCESKGQCWGIV